MICSCRVFFQETTGVFELNISTHPEVRSFDIEVVTQVSYPQYDILGSSDTALFVIVPGMFRTFWNILIERN